MSEILYVLGKDAKFAYTGSFLFFFFFQTCTCTFQEHKKKTQWMIAYSRAFALRFRALYTDLKKSMQKERHRTVCEKNLFGAHTSIFKLLIAIIRTNRSVSQICFARSFRQLERQPSESLTEKGEKKKRGKQKVKQRESMTGRETQVSNRTLSSFSTVKFNWHCRSLSDQTTPAHPTKGQIQS